MWRCLRQSHSLWRQRPLVPQTATRCLSSEAGKGVPYESQLKDVKGAGSQAVPQSADAVIIGGGAIGCSILYHLTKLGMKNVVLLEKDQLTAGTTWHTAGLLWNLRPNDIDIQLIRHSRNLMKSLEEETGVHSGWVENGGLWVASNETRLNEFKRMQSLGKFFGIPSYHLSQAETKELYPLLDVADVIGSIYSPEDGTIDPAGYCTGLSRAARSRGGQVITGCSVTDIKTGVDDFGTKRVKAVETNFGTIQTDNVVNACGVWAPHIGAMAGVNVPLVAMRHAYVVTEKIEGIQNMPNLRDHDASVYLKLQGDALCVGGYEPNPIFIDKMDSEFAFSLYELDWDVFLYNMEGIMKCVPAIAESGVKSTVCGPESFTADHKPLAGESPEVRGFHLCCGFNSGGMMFSGGFGWQMAEWIINGKPTLDMYSYDIRRFTTKLTDNSRWIKERSHESYAKNYSIVFPHDEPLAGRNMRKDALHQVLEDAGCVYQERQGWERPGWFSTSTTAHIRDYDYYGYYDYPANTNYTYNDKLQLDYTFDFPENHFMIENEALTCRQRVALFNMSYFTKLFLSGPDAQKAVDWIFSNDMRKPNGSTVYTCMLNKRAGIEGDLTVSVVEPSETGQAVPTVDGRCFYIAVGGAMGQYAISHLNDIIQDNKFDVRLDDKSDEMCLLSVQGPRSRDVLQPLCNSDLSDEAFPFSTNKLVTIAGHEVLAMRVSFVGELGWELHVPSSTAVDVYHAVMAAGAEKGICNAGYRAIDALSIEKGYRHWHGDVRPDDSPLESGLLFTCKLKTDVPFLGRDALEERRKWGAKKKLACFTIDEHVALQSLEAIYRDGLPVGYLRRADYAFALGKSIGYGYVHHPHGETVNNAFLKSGEYHIERMGVKYPATLHLKTPFDPKNERVKGIYTAHVDPMVKQAQN